MAKRMVTVKCTSCGAIYSCEKDALPSLSSAVLIKPGVRNCHDTACTGDFVEISDERVEMGA